MSTSPNHKLSKNNCKRTKKEDAIRKKEYYYRTRDQRLLQKAVKYRNSHIVNVDYTPRDLDSHGMKFVRNYFEKFGYLLLSDSYSNNREKLLVKCPVGHEWETTFHGFKDAKYRCLYCHLDGERTPYIEIDKNITSIGYKWIDGDINKSYVVRDKITYVCDEGHLNTVQYATLKYGFRCKKCSFLGLKNSFKDIKEKFASFNYMVVGNDYVNNKTPIECICDKGHKCYISYSNFCQGHRCMKCFSASTSSKIEKYLADCVSSFVGEDNVVRNNREIIPPHELDIYFPNSNLAVEVCGLYWHSEISGGKEKKYHYNKMIHCFEKGIRLITVFEDEIRDKFDIVLSRILTALNLSTNRVYARKCELREIDNKEANKFFEENHIQGRSTSKKAWGLYYNNDLVAACSIGSIGRKHAGGPGVIELKRLCSKNGTSVVGGAGKLFSCVKKYALSEGFMRIKSYCDTRYSNPFNSVYEILGFKKIGYTKYTPHYIKNGKRYRNISLRKTPEERLTGLTEWELRRAQGYDRLWDTGHVTYIYEVVGQ